MAIAIAGIVTECDRLGIRKIPRKNSTLTRMNREFVSDVLCNPVYCGKIAYGRRYLEKPDKTGKRKMVKPKDYILVDGRHEAIISYEQFQEAQKIREARAPMPNCTLCETDFINSLTIYLKTDIATARNSDNYLLRVFACMDRRVGKRMLVKIKDEVKKLPDWVKQFYQIRCEADGIVFHLNE